MEAIKVENLTKRFNGFTAVDNIGFSVNEGEIFGFLGPNGAGKTTTLNMLSTLLAPTSGNAHIAGNSITEDRDSVRRSIGIVFQDQALDRELTGRENLEFHSMMYGIDKTSRRERIKEVLEIVELSDKADTFVKNYSGGMRRRLEIARGLIHRPKVLFLDEPTLGLDAQTRRHIWEYVKKLNQENNITIILTTHYMEEADYLCDRIAIVDYGKIIALDTSQNLKDSLGGDMIYLETEGDPDGLAGELSKLDYVKSVKVLDGSSQKVNGSKKVLCVTVERGEKRIAGLILAAERLGVGISSVNLKKPSLEDVFLSYTGKTIRDTEGGDDIGRVIMRRRFAR